MAARRVGVWLLVLALLAAQALGLLHRTVHLAGGAPASIAAIHADERGAPATSWAGKLFAGHDGDADCRLFDQSCGSGLVTSPAALVLPVLVPLQVLLWFQGEALARWAALFDARGPPSLP